MQLRQAMACWLREDELESPKGREVSVVELEAPASLRSTFRILHSMAPNRLEI